MFPFAGRVVAVVAVCASLLVASSRAFAFALIGDSWPLGTDIVMHLSLSRAAASFPDGSASWNASAADALQIWNGHLQNVRFVQAGSVPSGNGDGRNSVFFSNTVYGEKFGTGVIAVTVGFTESSNPQVIVETDVIFNNAERWDSYRGPMRNDPKGNPIFDLHRVALHEFGHVLGLDHPDQANQIVHALMNSRTDDNDSLTDDDIAGAQHLYGSRKQDAVTGSEFSYQVTAGNQPTSYSATGLPPGLTIDGQSGVIRGVPTISGVYSVSITAHGPTRTVTLTLQITVKPPPEADRSQGTLLAKIDISVARFAADPNRPRVYATMPQANSVAVIDTTSLKVLATIPVGSQPTGLAVSADGSKLWVGNFGSTESAISVIDLNSLAVVRTIAAPAAARFIVEGRDNRLYASTGLYEGSRIMQINGETGVIETYFESLYGGALLAISPDRNTLYAADRGGSPAHVLKIDVSTPNPVVLQRNGSLGSNGQDLKLSNDGSFLCFSVGSGNRHDGGYSTSKLPTSNLLAYEGVFVTGAYPGPVAFSGDDTVIFHAVAGSQSRIAMFDTRTFAQLGNIPLGVRPNGSGGLDPRDVAVDNTGSLLFVATTTADYPANGDLRIYATGRRDPQKASAAAARTLVNVSTRLRSQPGDDALIGGFIITGQEPKKVALRAIGPSLPVAGRMADPVLSLYRSDGTAVAENDNWNSQRDEVRASGLAPADEHEAVITAVLQPGSYTAVVRGGGANTAGVALVELYDLSASSSARVANISSRGKVETGDNVMIGGFIVGGDQPTRVIVRAIGPSLRESGVASALEDTTLDLHDGNGALLASNDNWRSDQQAEIAATTIPPSHDRESAIVRTLAPGNYTAIIRGRNETSGVALVEVYNLETN